jgi:hypothetical protein
MSVAGFVFPIRGPYSFRRVDKGQDFQTRPGSALVAVTSGTLSAGSDPSGFGPRYPILHGDDGRSYYYGHVDLPAGMAGRHVNAGDVIARTGAPRGNATSPGWLEFGDASLLGRGGETGGQAISGVLHAAAGKGSHVGIGAAAGAGAAGGAALGAFAGPEGAAIGAAGGAVIGGVGSLLQDPIKGAESAAGAAAAAGVRAVANDFWTYAKDHWSAFLLKLAFIAAGAALVVTGLVTALGVQRQFASTVRAIPKAVPVPVPV